ncbi:ABC transporter permease [Pseudovibrio sp. SPO723]|uniref:ABC transporter permease n=1 Tax=Nesiotobacter zosterae TaxID=392721 RepID=UPI0029C22A18|nr:ABC transporter permease [Pseudovibrio sp. SPO723]MDX5594883.1 ABC transporter permease [Pseudovibrio sp. SPO723]
MKPISTPGFKLAARFALREMRGGLKGFFVFIACIALGVMAISGVASVSRALTEGIASEGQSILGGDLSFSLIHRQATDIERTYLEGLGQMSEVATLRAMARQPEKGEQTLIELKAADSAYPLYGEAVLGSGKPLHSVLNTNAQDGLWNGVADIALLARLNIEVGDVISVGRIQVRVADTIELEPDRLGNGMAIGPRLMVAPQALEAAGLIQPGSLVTFHYRIKLPDLETDGALNSVIEEAKAAFPDAGWRIQSRANASPQLQRNIQRFAQFLTLVGLTALVVGGVGVANAVRSYLDTKREVIASFKCVGASGGFVFRIYLVQIMALAGIGILVGLVLGAIIPLIALTLLAPVLPIGASVGIYPLELLLGALYGGLTALAFAIWPLGRAHDVPPTVLFRDSVSHKNRYPKKRYVFAMLGTLTVLAVLALALAYDKNIAMLYLVAAIGAYVLLILVARFIMWAAKRTPHVRSTEWRLAISNLHRPGALTPSVILSLGLGLTLLVALALIDGNLRSTLTQTAEQDAPSFFFVDIQNHEKDGFLSFVSEQAPEGNLDTVPMLRGRITALNGIPSDQVPPPPDDGWVLRGDRGITYSNTLPENSEVVDGEWWPEDYSGPPLVSFAEEIGRNLSLEVGDTVTVNVLGREITAEIANFRTVDWRSMSINFVMLFSANTFAGAPHTHLATITWDDNPTVERELELLKQVTQAYPTVTSVRVKDAIAQVNNLVGQLSWAVRGASSITLIASVLVLGGALAAGHRNRIYDAVILKTLGATRGRLVYAYLAEYMLLGLATALFSLLAGSLAARFVMVDIMGGEFSMLPGTALAAVVGALVFTIGFGLLGTWRVLGEKPAPVLRNL